MVTFSPDGTKVHTANEGEPDDNEDPNPPVDPPGSISIIDLSAGVAAAAVTNISFEAFDGREDELRNRGIRIFPGRTTSLDLEPEYIAVSPDGTQAFVTLQEANAFAIIDLTPQTLTNTPGWDWKRLSSAAIRAGKIHSPAWPMDMGRVCWSSSERW